MGLHQCHLGGGNVNDLIGVVAAQLKPPARLLYLAGEERAGDLAGALQAKNFLVDTVVVYRLLIGSALPEPAATALAGGHRRRAAFLARGRRCLSQCGAQFAPA